MTCLEVTCVGTSLAYPAFLTTIPVGETETMTSIAERVLFVAPASRRLFCAVSKVHQTAGETPALQNRGGSSRSIVLLLEGEPFVRKAA